MKPWFSQFKKVQLFFLPAESSIHTFEYRWHVYSGFDWGLGKKWAFAALFLFILYLELTEVVDLHVLEEHSRLDPNEWSLHNK